MRIIRHPLIVTDYQRVDLPNDGDLLSVATSRTCPNDCIDLWSTDYERGAGAVKGVYIVGTGHTMPPEIAGAGDKELRALDPWRQFIGTVVTPSGLVWHVFEGPVQ